ncbi:Prophage integrase IntA [Tepidimonas sediminis]|uniref:Prophage integrase IntA n=1 Tax=Tepidimonas sediminis TaxID=2588941 RepID=A0A554WTK9_9BURK|nr:tyrosine-type recombinase/integrase [Tepidimonas sediminis]TSE26903.1 Prophage integrase IntA [Tepidimonas sediminis]
MTARVRLTAGRVAAFTCPPGQTQAFLRDSEVPTLALRATPAGAKSYVFEAKLQRRTVRVTIGDPAHWTIEAARARARELAALLDRGIDPREEARRQQQQREAERARQQAAQACALDVWQRYCEERRRAWGERHYADHVKLARAGGDPVRRGKGTLAAGPLYQLLNRPLAQLDAATVERWAAKHAAERPTVARLCLRLLGVFMNWCRAHPDYRHAMPDGNPAKSRRAREALGSPQAKTDALLREQLRPWFEAVRTQDPAVSAYLQALLLTGARPGELLQLRWSDVDFQWKSLTIRDKVEGERTIPLTPYVAALLAGLPRRGPYVFMSGKTDGPIAPPNHAATRVCRLAGVPPVTLHGLRRSFKSLSEWVEVPVGVTAQIMGHKPSATAEKHYTVRPLDLLAKWHVKIEGWILEQAGIEQPSAEDAAQRLRVVA